MKEIFKEIPFTDGRYSCSNTGLIRSNGWLVTDVKKHVYLRPPTILKPYINNKGYKMVSLRLKDQNKTIDFLVHRLVAMTWIENPNNYPIVNHIDANTLNNNIENLEWCDQSHNLRHTIALGRRTFESVSKPVDVYDMNKKYLASYSSIKLALRTMGISVHNGYLVSQCCKHKRESACGYKWEFSKNFNKKCNDYRKAVKAEPSRVGLR